MSDTIVLKNGKVVFDDADDDYGMIYNAHGALVGTYIYSKRVIMPVDNPEEYSSPFQVMTSSKYSYSQAKQALEEFLNKKKVRNVKNIVKLEDNFSFNL